MITALPVPSVKVFHKTYYQEKGSRIASSQPGSPLAESEAVLALMDKEPPEYYFCGKVRSSNLISGKYLKKDFTVTIYKMYQPTISMIFLYTAELINLSNVAKVLLGDRYLLKSSKNINVSGVSEQRDTLLIDIVFIFTNSFDGQIVLA